MPYIQAVPLNNSSVYPPAYLVQIERLPLRVRLSSQLHTVTPWLEMSSGLQQGTEITSPEIAGLQICGVAKMEGFCGRKAYFISMK